MKIGSRVYVLCTRNEEVDDDEENDRVSPVANESGTETTEDNVDGDADGQQEAGGDGVHPRERVHRGGTTHYDGPEATRSVTFPLNSGNGHGGRTKKGSADDQGAYKGVEREKQMRSGAEPRLDNLEEGVSAVSVHFDFGGYHREDGYLNGTADTVPPVPLSSVRKNRGLENVNETLAMVR